MNRKTKRTKKSDVKRIGLEKIGINFPAMVSVIISILLTLILMACGSSPSTSSEITVQPALPTPTLEPTFTLPPSSTDTPVPKPTDTPTPEPTPTPVPPASLSGLIVDQSTNQPIAEAEVGVGDQMTTTNDNGRYTLTDLPPGQYVLSVTHPDYDPGLSSIFTVAAGEEPIVDVSLYAPDTSPYPEDPMLTNPLDPNGAPAKEDAERLAREQGLTGEVVNIEETTLTGEYLVNYKLGDNVRAAVAELNHEAWELTDDAGRKWWIIKVCGNLASPLPAQKPIPTPNKPISQLMAEVVVDELSVRACTSDECAKVGTVSRGEQVEVFGCLADKSWCEVSWSGGRGWCTGRSLRQLAVAEAVPVVEVMLPSETSGDLENGRRKILFTSHKNDNPEIYVINADGSGLTRLTHSDLHELQAAWSPNGKQIVFVGSRNLNFDIYTMNAVGSDIKRLTDNPLNDDMPVWSPDGQYIAFRSERERKNNFHIYLMNADGSGLRPLVEDNCDDKLYYCPGGRNPTWSPDGRQIAFEYLNSDIYMINADGTDLKALTSDKDAIRDQEPTWSPDGQKIAFTCFQGNAGDICVMNADGSSKVNLTSHPSGDFSPVWSPNSQQIAFLSDRDGDRQIYLMNADGSDLRRFTDNTTVYSNLFWSSDGQQFAFISEWYIYVMNADGSNPKRLTDYYVSWAFLDWLP